MFPYARLLIVVLLGGCVDLSRPPGLVTIGGTGGRGGSGGGAGGGDSAAGGSAGDSGGGGREGGGEGPELGAGGADAMAEAEPPLDAPLLAAGMRCSEHAQCALGICADGFCCQTECPGTCKSCGLPGGEGTCSPVPAGMDPRNECEQQPMASCGQDGECNGQGACSRYPAGIECVPGSCSAGTEYAARTCDGNGVCKPASSRSCAPNMCTDNSCASSCTMTSDCQPGFFCEVGKCVVRRPTGALCMTGSQCASNHCIDGYCCNIACNSLCQSCSVAGKAGTCSPIPTGTDPQNECPAEAAATCGRAGGCNGGGACRLHAATTSCGSQSCTGFIETSARACNGSGVCVAAVTRDCAPYLCNGTACRTSCTSTSHCRAGNYCSAGGACVPFGAGPVMHWRFDEASGGVAADSSGNNHVGSYIGSSGAPTASTTLPPVTFTNPFSRRFVASSRQAVRLAPAPGAIRPANNMTIALWFRTTNLDIGHDPPAASEAISQGDNYLIRVRATDISFTRRSGGSYLSCFSSGGPNHLDGNWHHVAAVLSPAGMRLYIDGVERCSNSQGGSMLYDKGDDLYVGRHGNPDSGAPNDWDFDGNIDDVRIYNRPLPADEVAALGAGF
jgi:hypothetical protein